MANEMRMKAHNDVRIHSYFSGCISHELEATYMQQVSKYPLLTQEEEVKWTTLHFASSRGRGGNSAGRRD